MARTEEQVALLEQLLRDCERRLHLSEAQFEVFYRASWSLDGCDFCGQNDGHSKRCAVTKFGVNPKPPYRRPAA